MKWLIVTVAVLLAGCGAWWVEDTYDPAAYTAGYLDGVRAAKAVVIEALDKYMEVKT